MPINYDNEYPHLQKQCRKLKAEIKRLRDALEQIAASTPLDDEAVAVARAALKEQDND